MTTQYEGLDVWSETIDHVTDDDSRDASAYVISAIGLADRTRYLKNRGFYSTPAFGGTHTNAGVYRIGGQIVFTNTAGNTIELSTPRLYARSAIPMARYVDLTDWEDHAFGVSTNMSGYRQIDAVAPTEIVFVYDLPSACILKRGVVTVYPNNAHVGLNLTRPRLQIWAHSIRTGVGSMIAEALDPSAVYGDYNTPHQIIATISDVAYSPNEYVISARFRGESGNDALVDLNVLIPRIEYTRATVGEEFGEFLP